MYTGIILSGGKSKRMGENKAFLKIEGIPIILRIYHLFQELFNETIIVTDQKDLYRDLDVKIYNDLIPNKGALGGLYTGLFFSSSFYSFIVACDMPFLNESVIHYLINHLDDHDVIIPQTKDGLQPLHAFYSKRCLEPIKHLLNQGRVKILDFFPLIKMKIINEIDFISLDPLKKSFINVNTPEELILLTNENLTTKLKRWRLK